MKRLDTTDVERLHEPGHELRLATLMEMSRGRQSRLSEDQRVVDRSRSILSTVAEDVVDRVVDLFGREVRRRHRGRS